MDNSEGIELEIKRSRERHHSKGTALTKFHTERCPLWPDIPILQGKPGYQVYMCNYQVLKIGN